MNCRELVEFITDYIEGRLPSGETERFEGHLAECPHCNIYLEQMRTAISAVGKLEERDVSPEARQELQDVFRNWREGLLDAGDETPGTAQIDKRRRGGDT